jgi:hypothetical protein
MEYAVKSYEKGVLQNGNSRKIRLILFLIRSGSSLRSESPTAYGVIRCDNLKCSRSKMHARG